MNNNHNEIEQLFTQYVNAFLLYDIDQTQTCYHLPCTLHTADRAVYIADEHNFKREFNDIFAMLKQADINDFNVLKASYRYVSETIILACVDWQFLALDPITQQQGVFTEFSAFYHITNFDGKWKILNVVSQEITQSVTLDVAFAINE